MRYTVCEASRETRRIGPGSNGGSEFSEDKITQRSTWRYFPRWNRNKVQWGPGRKKQMPPGQPGERAVRAKETPRVWQILETAGQ